ncbi:MAG: lipoprotein, partial [Burkholderiaceae bacterium]
ESVIDARIFLMLRGRMSLSAPVNWGLALCVASFFGLAACGQKGPLTLPKATPTQAAASAPGALR